MNLAIINSISSAALLIKIITLIIIIFYTIFTLIVSTQIKVMTDILYIPHSKPIFKTISTINIVLAILLFLFALVIL
jgi:hypothetical protein